jgi:hypothetical protein
LSDDEEIAGYLGDLCAQESTHRVEVEVAGREREALTEARECPDGARVPGAQTPDLREGRIARGRTWGPGTGW